jgi:hypothetical protein
VIRKADQPNPVVDLFDSDDLAGEDPAEIDFLPIEADAVRVQRAAGRLADRQQSP